MVVNGSGQEGRGGVGGIESKVFGEAEEGREEMVGIQGLRGGFEAFAGFDGGVCLFLGYRDL